MAILTFPRLVGPHGHEMHHSVCTNKKNGERGDNTQTRGEGNTTRLLRPSAVLDARRVATPPIPQSTSPERPHTAPTSNRDSCRDKGRSPARRPQSRTTSSPPPCATSCIAQ